MFNIINIFSDKFMALFKTFIKYLIRRIEKVVIFYLPDTQANLFQTSIVSWNTYFTNSEDSIHIQWNNIIWPIIKNFNFKVILELAPGAGRNTEKLTYVSKKIYAIDYDSKALEKCRKRLGDYFNNCEIIYYINNGKDLKMLLDRSVSAIYCWDSAVHFNKAILSRYIEEFARVLNVGGRGFVHHSNLGDKASKDIKDNPGWRSDVSKEFFFDTCIKCGLTVETQIDIPWGNIIDCGTVFYKSDNVL